MENKRKTNIFSRASDKNYFPSYFQAGVDKKWKSVCAFVLIWFGICKECVANKQHRVVCMARQLKYLYIVDIQVDSLVRVGSPESDQEQKKTKTK